MGYDLLNEPWPGTGWQLCANNVGCPAFDRNKLTPFSQRVHDRIREVDRRNIVWYEPNVIYNNGAKTHHGDIGPTAGMSFHIYCLQEGSTPGRSPFDPAQQQGCSTFEELPLQNADLQSSRTGDTLMLSEFGATDDLGQIQRVVEGAERHMVSWQYWHYCTCADPTTSGVGPTQALVLDPGKTPAGSNVKADKLGVLARPYPQAVAGTPERWSFDPGTRVFELAYSLRPAGGKRPTYTPTEVFVPKRHYPKGYSVEAKGARVVSKPNAQLLLLRAKRAVGRAEVRVSPR